MDNICECRMDESHLHRHYFSIFSIVIADAPMNTVQQYNRKLPQLADDMKVRYRAMSHTGPAPMNNSPDASCNRCANRCRSNASTMKSTNARVFAGNSVRVE